MDARNSRKDALAPRDTDRFTELLLDPLMTFSEAEDIVAVEKQVRNDNPGSGVLIREKRKDVLAC